MSTPLAGIESIELVPDIADREVARRLKESLRQSTSMRAAVAYWCLGVHELGPDIVARLRGDGFLCVDIHLPTDIDRLAQLVSGGANVFLYLLNPNPQPGELKLQVPPHLLHSKMLLLDFSTGPSELWVGSHNWTARALTGVNIETSVRALIHASSTLYTDAVAFLDGVRARCVRFDLSAVNYYKWLQGFEFDELIWVVELRGNRDLLKSHGKLTVFGRTAEDYRDLRQVDKNIVVSLLDDATGVEALYEATISDTGHHRGAGVDFDARLYAAHDGSPRPHLRGPEVPPKAARTAARSWATIALLDELSGATSELPPRERWETATDELEHFKISAELRDWFTRPDRPLVQRPIPRDVFEGRQQSADASGRRRLPGGMMIRRKVVRARRLTGEVFTLKARPQPSESDQQ